MSSDREAVRAKARAGHGMASSVVPGMVFVFYVTWYVYALQYGAIRKACAVAATARGCHDL